MVGGIGGGVQWPGCTKICCDPENKSQKRCYLGERAQYSRGAGRIGDGWMTFVWGVKELDRDKKWRDVI